MIWAGRWTIGICMFLATVVGGYYAFAVASAQFTATARLVLEQRQNQVVDIDTVLSGVSTDSAALNTELEFIRSRKLIGRVVDDLGLVADPEFNSTLREQPSFSIDQAKNKIRGVLLGSSDIQAPAPTAEKIHENTVNTVRGAVAVSTQRNTYIFMVRATTGSAKTSADIANRLAQVYIDNQIEKKFSATEYAINWLTERISELESELEQRDNEIKKLRSETNLVNTETLEALNIRFKELRERLANVELTISTSAQKLTDANALVEAGQIDEINDFFDDAALKKLQRQISLGRSLGTNRALFFSRVETLIGDIETSVDRATAQRDALQSSFDLLQAQITDQTEDLSKLNQLQRDLEATRILHQTFLSRLKETSIQIGLQQADAEILSEAVRGRQIAPRRSRIILICMILGGVVGVGIILSRQLLNNCYHTASELEHDTGISVIGTIPKTAVRQGKDLVQYLSEKPTSAMAEAIRNMRTSVLLANIDTPAQIIMSTSSIPGEGKTTQSIGLAQNLSGLGKRVLLIECDMRRRVFPRYFDVSSPLGLLSALSGDHPLDQVIQHDDTLGADIIFGEETHVNAADVFSSERFLTLLTELRTMYDYIVVDTPPVLAVPDARIIGQHCDAIIYSVKWDTTNKEQVSSGLQQLYSVGLKPTGLVLSVVDTRRLKTYGYGSYGSQVSKYYGT